jgi:periplasmic divalent cation tolerance protein
MKEKASVSGNRFALVWITSPNRATSLKLARLLVDGRLASCVNIIPGLQSRYWWKGKVETASEELLAAKTLVSQLPKLEAAVQKSHPYEVCEVIALPLLRGNASYLRWISESLGAGPKPKPKPGKRRGRRKNGLLR